MSSTSTRFPRHSRHALGQPAARTIAAQRRSVQKVLTFPFLASPSPKGQERELPGKVRSTDGRPAFRASPLGDRANSEPVRERPLEGGTPKKFVLDFVLVSRFDETSNIYCVFIQYF